MQAIDLIKNEVGSNNVAITLAFVGVHAPNYPVNLIHLWNSGTEEGVIQVQLKPGAPFRMEQLTERMRQVFAEKMPEVKFSFEPSDIVSRVMSFGSPTPIEIAVAGPNLVASREYADKIREKLAKLTALRDIQFGQSLDYPTVDIALNRERAGLLGVKVADATRSLVAATASSRFTVPTYWADPVSGVSYQIQVQVPQVTMNSVEEIKNVPVSSREGKTSLLRKVANVSEGTMVGEYDRYNMQRLITITANIYSADLGSITKQVRAVLKEAGEHAGEDAGAILRGQIVPMEQMFDGLKSGLILAIVVILLLLAAYFESVLLSLIVISTIPAVIAGVACALWLTGTTLNIQSFMGAIMAVGVAVANAILLVTFAERNRLEGAEAKDAAVEGARSRLRPILMTSLAMMAGMLPMAFGFGQGGEQTAPLGRAVIGGLAAATLSTLLILPSVYAIVRQRSSRKSVSLDPHDPQSRYHSLTNPQLSNFS